MIRRAWYRALHWCLLIALIATVEVHFAAAEITRILAIGDSLTDTGNLHHASDGMFYTPPYWQGRASNGPIWVEYLADHLSVPTPTASRLGGTNGAYAYATTGADSFHLAVAGAEVSRLGMQIEEILETRTLTDEDLIVVWAGENDFIRNPLGSSTPEQVVDNLTDHITTLHAAGGTLFLTANLFGSYGNFNELWRSRAEELEQTLPVDIFFFDFSALISDVLANPASYGFTGSGWDQPIVNRVVADPDRYAVWDELGHPTTALHRVMAERALAELRQVDGDYNDNGIVEQADLDLVLLNWGGRARPAPIGWLIDLPIRSIDQEELDRVLLNWGNTSVVKSLAISSSSVPEPSAYAVIALAIAPLTCALGRSKRNSLR